MFAQLPAVWPGELLPAIQAELAASPNRKLVVLDDDPTGTQTVRDVAVVTRWDEPTLERELRTTAGCFYILTNSRALPAAAAAELAREVGRNLRAAAQRAGVGLSLVSRSDSTLRGHFPVETDALAETAGPFDATLLMPYFEEGGRYTVRGRHYVAEGAQLVPAAETPFARDAAFGYRQSDLPAWVEEKTAGRIPAPAVTQVTIDDLRRGPEHVAGILLQLPAGSVAAIDGCDRSDAQVVALATLRAEARGRRFLYRTAASFVAARLALAGVPLWVPPRTAAGRPGGLVVVGSYVPKTTRQLEHLRAVEGLEWLELQVPPLLREETRESEIQRAADAVNRRLGSGRDVVVFTSRDLVVGGSPESSLAIGQRVSEAVVAVVSGVSTRPHFLVAKGGITSSDIATRALGVTRAWIPGVIAPGVPVWQLGEGSRFPGLAYVVFPGNVGADDTLAAVVSKLRGGDA